MTRCLTRVMFAGLALGALAGARPLAGQDAAPSELPALIAAARAGNPDLRAAGEAVAAARARADAAGAPPDPRLGVGLVNALVSDPLSSDEEMTMRMIELGTTVPYPGKLGLERRIAASELAEVEAERDGTERDIVAAVEEAYYEIYFADRGLDVVERNRELLTDLVTLTEARYGVGLGEQQDVLAAQVERASLGAEVLALAAQRAASAARLNALLDRPSEAPMEPPVLPERVQRAAVPAPGLAVRFDALALDAELADTGPLPSLAALQRLAQDHSPELRAAAARIESQRQRAALAGKAALPDLDVSAGYGQRSGRPDMLTLMASVPLPLFRGRKQDALTAAAQAELAQLEAARAARANDVRAQVAALHAGLVRTRQQIALFREGILPQAHAALESAVAGYPVGRGDVLTLLNSQVTLFRNDLEYYRLLTDFARDLAELERVVGREVL